MLDRGEKIEQGPPEVLLERKGHFYEMVKESGVEELERMVHFAKNKQINMTRD